VPVTLINKYINPHAGATARNTMPTNLARKLEKRIIALRAEFGLGIVAACTGRVQEICFLNLSLPNLPPCLT
jgi:hypothetical protein